MISKDKYNRFGILVPMTKVNPDAEAIETEDCASFLYTSTLADAREASTSSAQPIIGMQGGEQTGAESLWRPPDGEESSTREPVTLWRPPGTEDEPAVNMTADSWQPPGHQHSNPWNTNLNSESSEMSGPGDRHSTGIKRGFDEISEEKNGGSEETNFHTDTGAAAADAFYSGLTRNLDTRADSRLYHMRAFNGWVKATQISELNPRIVINGTKQPMRPLRVLDLACGKGGDLKKWLVHHPLHQSNRFKMSTFLRLTIDLFSM